MPSCFENCFSYWLTGIDATLEIHLGNFVNLSMSVTEPFFYYHEMLKFQDQQTASLEVLL